VALEGDTVAVNVTGCAAIDGFGLDDIVMVVGSLFTTWVSVAEVLELLVVSPL
jgi:hypothetical protein